MSEGPKPLFEPSFNRAVKIRSRDDRLTSDAGTLLVREADSRLGLTESLAEGIKDPRDPARIRYTALELIRERLYSLALGYAAQDDCDRIAHDPAFRLATWNRPGDRVLDERLASQPTQSRLVDMLASEENRQALQGALSEWSERHLLASGSGHSVSAGTIDVDGFPVEVHGSQSGGHYNGYYRKTVYSPYVASFAPGGDYDSARLGDGFVHAMLRKGNAASHQDALEFIRSAYRRCSARARRLDVRLDAGFTFGSVLDGLEDDGIRFVGRLKTNRVLQDLAAPHVNRPVGRPPLDGYEYTVELGDYQAESWKHAHRVVLCVVDKPDPKTGQLEMLPHSFFLVTSWRTDQFDGDQLLEHYRRRGTFEDRLSELWDAIRPRLSSPEFEENEVTLLLALLAFNLANVLRGELEQSTGSGWDLARVQTSVLKAGGRITTTGRRLIVDVPRAVVSLWQRLITRLSRWSLPSRYGTPKGAERRPWTAPPKHAHLVLVLRE